jgi:membrane protein YdbS with pleckstrin-like domain
MWIVVVLWGAALALVFGGIDVGRSATPMAFKALFLLICIPSVVLMPWILHGTSYVLTDEALLIRCGPFRQRIPVRAIQEVVPSRNPVSSPACSLDRLHVKYQGSRPGVLISPSDKQSFLEQLAGLDPQLSLRGDGIVRDA